ncbi:hypothetical protein FN846DRAFT_918177 [Sphaerosporella brunnea]|uniref:Uncharacterized protein n=1 Tax=Sphaerosporella brunnea TaxID=1250544 RepID=A0A5J5F1E7_9PEZI|nr:hypothetical protein FN846DRAFT_918177 [Sphaerosporella brunnea]
MATNVEEKRPALEEESDASVSGSEEESDYEEDVPREQQLQRQQQQQQQQPQQKQQVARQQQGQDVEKKGKSSAPSVRLDLNIELEVTLKARIHGDLTLALLT